MWLIWELKTYLYFWLNWNLRIQQTRITTRRQGIGKRLILKIAIFRIIIRPSRITKINRKCLFIKWKREETFWLSHEYYTFRWNETKAFLKGVFGRYAKIVFLNNIQLGKKKRMNIKNKY